MKRTAFIAALFLVVALFLTTTAFAANELTASLFKSDIDLDLGSSDEVGTEVYSGMAYTDSYTNEDSKANVKATGVTIGYGSPELNGGIKLYNGEIEATDSDSGDETKYKHSDDMGYGLYVAGKAKVSPEENDVVCTVGGLLSYDKISNDVSDVEVDGESIKAYMPDVALSGNTDVDILKVGVTTDVTMPVGESCDFVAGAGLFYVKANVDSCGTADLGDGYSLSVDVSRDISKFVPAINLALNTMVGDNGKIGIGFDRSFGDFEEQVIALHGSIGF